MFCKLKRSITSIKYQVVSQVMPSIVYLEHMDSYDNYWYCSHFVLFFSHSQIHYMRSIMFAIVSWPVKILLFILGCGGLHAISLHPFLILFAIDSEIYFPDTDCKKKSLICQYQISETEQKTQRPPFTLLYLYHPTTTSDLTWSFLTIFHGKQTC